MRDKDRSSMADREEANINLRTAGVIGMRLALAVADGNVEGSSSDLLLSALLDDLMDAMLPKYKNARK